MQQQQSSVATRFIDPSILARIANLELLAKTVVDGFISGLHRSPHLGLSIDFAEHRAYMPGDDIRRIDWRVFARTDRLYVKEFEADTNANFSVLLDTSASMDYLSDEQNAAQASQARLSKLDYARFLAASLSYMASRQRDRIGLITFDHEVIEHIPCSAKHLNHILHSLDRMQRGQHSDFVSPLQSIAQRLRQRSILALISDLYDEPSRIVSALSELSLRGHDVLVFHILDPAELAFEFNQANSFEDIESGERLAIVPEQLRAQYQQLMNDHISQLSHDLGHNNIDYIMFDTSQPLDHALAHFLRQRAALSRVR